ncbi:MAG: tRNA 2-thiouridine(34) synthase MnmA [Flavobacteriaceae bacterium]|nr:tRNA 2-thiouridine(34) synthase MnmA [Flavobacteriaceae bacterium]
MSFQKKRIVVGLSGGVDSSVTAYLLKKQGHEVIGLFMKNWHDDSVTISDECPWLEDSNDAMLVADKLGIPFQTVDLSETYKERIVDYMFAEYKQGRTPNPDVLCNREIKFDVFLNIALKLGADFVATGHYCRKAEVEVDGQVHYRLLAGVDSNKDQSYFLCQLTQQQLSKALFPIGELTKPEVRHIAQEQGLITAEKRDSQGLCFIGKVRLPDFLQQQLQPKTGDIVKISDQHPMYGQVRAATPATQSEPYVYTSNDGKVVGQHQGAHFFTVGQRKGLAVGGTAEPLFVIDTDVDTNILFVGEGKDHPGLYRNALFIDQSELHFVRLDLSPVVGASQKVLARIRYRQPLVSATLHRVAAGAYLQFDVPQSAIASGQFAAWYLDDELIGSGVIA